MMVGWFDYPSLNGGTAIRLVASTWITADVMCPERIELFEKVGFSQQTIAG